LKVCCMEELVYFPTVCVIGGAVDQDVVDAFYRSTSLTAAGVGFDVKTVGE